jgi:hypothetical protein
MQRGMAPGETKENRSYVKELVYKVDKKGGKVVNNKW